MQALSQLSYGPTREARRIAKPPLTVKFAWRLGNLPPAALATPLRAAGNVTGRRPPASRRRAVHPLRGRARAYAPRLTADATNSPMARDAVRAGDSNPNSCHRPPIPCAFGPLTTKSRRSPFPWASWARIPV